MESHVQGSTFAEDVQPSSSQLFRYLREAQLDGQLKPEPIGGLMRVCTNCKGI